MLTFDIIDATTPQGQSRLGELKAEKEKQVALGQQIYAKLKRTSKYYGQTSKNELFPVYIDPHLRGEYCVQGGPGGQYRMRDVTLWVAENGKSVRLA